MKLWNAIATARTASCERGSALILTLFVLVVLSGIGIALLVLSESGQRMGKADLQGKKSFYMAEAGLERARLALYAVNKNGGFDDDLTTAAGSDGTISFNLNNLEPAFSTTGLLTGFNNGVGDDTALVNVTPFADGAFAAFLTNDPLDGDAALNDTNDRVMITGIGGGPNRTLEVVRAIVERQEILASRPPATITILGPNPTFAGGASAAKEYLGDDCSGSGTFYPTVGVIGSGAASDVRSSLDKETYSAGGLTQEDTVADLTDAGEPTVSTPVHADWRNCRKVKAMIEEIRLVADVVCKSSSCSVPPSAPNRIVFADTDWDLDNGAGTLVVTGRLDAAGNKSWDGMILVIGTGEFYRGGGGGGTISGGVVVADVAGPDGIYGTTDDCTDGSGDKNAFGDGAFDTSGGGSSTVGYCEAKNEQATPVRMYEVVEFLQR